jgi:hypothetical protein
MAKSQGVFSVSVATIHDLNSASRVHRPVRAALQTAVDGPVVDATAVGATASVTVTVRIDLPGGQLPAGAVRLVESLRALAGPVTVNGPAAVDGTVNGPAAVNGPAMVDGTVNGPAEVDGPGAARSSTGDGRAQHPPVEPGDGPSLRVFLAPRIVLRDGVPVRLTRREFDLLAFFCARPRQVFDRRQLLRHVWGYEMVSGERTVDVHVRRLRIKLGDPGPLIATVWGVGYRLEEGARVTVVPG